MINKYIFLFMLVILSLNVLSAAQGDYEEEKLRIANNNYIEEIAEEQNMYPKGDVIEDTSENVIKTIPKITALLIIYLVIVVVAFIFLILFFARNFFGVGVREDL